MAAPRSVFLRPDRGRLLAPSRAIGILIAIPVHACPPNHERAFQGSDVRVPDPTVVAGRALCLLIRLLAATPRAPREPPNLSRRC